VKVIHALPSQQPKHWSGADRPRRVAAGSRPGGGGRALEPDRPQARWPGPRGCRCTTRARWRRSASGSGTTSTTRSGTCCSTSSGCA